jgi:AcrR family transcriptional regulator
MSAQGVDATTVQQITDTAHVGFGTFYNYAASKESLAREVLDCVIHNIGERNDLATRARGESDPVRIVANSVRFVIRETTHNTMWHWWFANLEVLVERFRVGFGPFGLRDIAVAVDADRYQVIDDDHILAWSQLNWLMAGAGKDIVDGLIAPEREAAAVEGILRIMGVDHEVAHAACAGPVSEAPELPIDFAFELADDADG